ncbi:hypothetical protein G6F42_019297 [Rhizopus arrhizus]|nr:hypothetical protein G6F42_019297 [Rhizopus arrhizus]
MIVLIDLDLEHRRRVMPTVANEVTAVCGTSLHQGNPSNWVAVVAVAVVVAAVEVVVAVAITVAAVVAIGIVALVAVVAEALFDYYHLSSEELVRMEASEPTCSKSSSKKLGSKLSLSVVMAGWSDKTTALAAAGSVESKRQ